MLLRTVECMGYKAFRRHTRIPLRKLTVFFGKNNSGKTTLARMPLIIAASITNSQTMYALSSSGLRFGSSFTGLASADQAHPKISFGIEWDSKHSIRFELQHIASRDLPDSVQPTYIEIDGKIDRRFPLQRAFSPPADKFIVTG